MTKFRKVKECSQIVLRTARRLVGDATVTPTQLEVLGKEISARARAIRRLEGASYRRSFDQAADELIKDQELELGTEERQLKLQQITNHDNADFLKRFNYKLKAGTSLFSGAESHIKGSGAGINQLTIATEHSLFGGKEGWVTKLEHDNLTKLLIDRDNETKIANAVLAIMDKKKLPTIDDSDPMQKIARIIIDKNEKERTLQNAYGGNIPRNANRIATTRWNPIRMRKMGGRAFIDLEMKLVNWDRSFPELDPEDREETLAQFYEDITLGMRTNNSPESVAEIAGRTKFYQRLHKRRIFYFKDGGSWLKHLHEVGGMGLAEALTSDTIKASKNIAILKRLGPRAELTLQAIMKKLAQKNPNAKFLQTRLDTIQYMYDDLNGTTNAATDYTIARIGLNARRFEGWTKLGFSTISSFSDIVNQIRTLRYNGVGYFDSMTASFDSFRQLFKTSEDQKAFAELVGTGAEQTIGNYNRFEAMTVDHGAMAALDKLYYKLNFLTKWDKTLKVQTSSILSRFLAQNKGLEFDELNARHKQNLGRYNIDKGQWDLLRRHPIKMPSGQEMILPDSADEATTDEIREYLGKPEASSPEIRRTRDSIHDNLMMYFVDQERHVILDSGSAERAILLRGTQAGTIPGEALRLIMQFKTYSTAFVTRMIARELHGGLGGKADVAGLIELVSGTILFSGLSYYAKSFLKGQVPDFTNENVLMNVLSPAMGIFGDILRDAFDSSDESFTASLAGPTSRTIDQTKDFMSRIAHWRKPSVAAWNLARHNIPFANLYFIDTFLRYSLLDNISNRIEPGSVERTRAYLERQAGLHSILPR